MTKEAAGRLGISCIIAIIGAIQLLSICKNPALAIRWWLVYAISCGVVLNTKRGERPRLLLIAAIAPAVTPLVVLAYPVAILRQDACFSGVKFTDLPADVQAGLVAFFFFVSWLGAFLFSFARTGLLAFLKLIAANQTKTTLQKIEATIRALIALVGAIALLYSRIS